jgi:hypothetical protein
MIKPEVPMVRPRMERLRSDIPERTVFDADDGIGRGAEVAVVNGMACLLLVGVAEGTAGRVVVGMAVVEKDFVGEETEMHLASGADRALELELTAADEGKGEEHGAEIDDDIAGAGADTPCVVSTCCLCGAAMVTVPAC